MSRVQDVFKVPRVLLPVIHPVSWTDAIANAKMVNELEIKGVFLINQGMDDWSVMLLANEIRRVYPALWVGVNILGKTPSDALITCDQYIHQPVSGLWADNAGIFDDDQKQVLGLEFQDVRRLLSWDGLYFGGVAFKHQMGVPDDRLGAVAKRAIPYMDVVCTSGPGTGRAATVEKVQAMREGVGTSHALALASGVNVDNVDLFLPYVDAFLVGTGIESKFGVFDRDKMRALQEKISTFDPARAGL